MLKIVVLFFFTLATLCGDEKSSATKIVKAIVSVVNPSSQVIWYDEKDQGVDLLFDVDAFSKARSCEEANVIVLSNKTALDKKCKSVPMLVLDYELLVNSENAVAAFFWKKGRPNIVFIKNRIDKFSIKLPKSYEMYQEDEIW